MAIPPSSFCPALRIIASVALLTAVGTTAGNGAEPALKQAQVKGLLVIQLADGSFAGAASQMNGTVVQGREDGFSLGFNQEVGDQMTQATAEVEKFIAVRHGDKVPSGYHLELAFADKYSPKDGPSAAVVCALLADSIITGDPIDAGFAATGDMTATGQVRGVGGITGKVRGAIKKDCAVIGIPKPNDGNISDLYLIEGIKPLYEIQIFSIATFDEARSIATTKRPEEVRQAISEFQEVQKVLARDERYVRNAAVQEKLRNIVQLAPNHLSARLLFLDGTGQGPRKLSLAGSIESIDKAAQAFSLMLTSGSFLDTEGGDDVLFSLINTLKRQRPKFDKRTLPLADAHTELAEYFKDIRGRKYLNAQMEREIDSRIRKLNAERTKIANDPEVREELMVE